MNRRKACRAKMLLGQMVIGATLIQLGCATPPAQPDESFRVVNRTMIVLPPLIGTDSQDPFSRQFEQRNIEGSISEAGRWSIKGLVEHTRLRCGVYEMGIQLGNGNPNCNAVEWFTEVEYGTRERQCNSAPILHAGGGTLPASGEEIAAASCVRVVTRCAGAC